MKTKLLLVLSIGIWLPTLGVRADVGNALITWTGNAGYHVEINLSYDNTFALVHASGSPPYSPIVGTNQGVVNLSVQFFDPSSHPLFSVVDVTNSVVLYRFLDITLNTVSGTLQGSLDVGKDSFAEGEPVSGVGQYYLSGTSLIDAGYIRQPVRIDSGGDHRFPISQTGVITSGHNFHILLHKFPCAMRTGSDSVDVTTHRVLSLSYEFLLLTVQHGSAVRRFVRNPHEATTTTNNQR
jgi:hypothetical protein